MKSYEELERRFVEIGIEMLDRFNINENDLYSILADQIN